MTTYYIHDLELKLYHLIAQTVLRASTNICYKSTNTFFLSIINTQLLYRPVHTFVHMEGSEYNGKYVTCKEEGGKQFLNC